MPPTTLNSEEPVYRCICDKNLEMFKAEEHLKRIKTT